YSQEEVWRVVRRSKPYKAPGLDMICGKLLDVLCEELLPHLAELYNVGLTLGYFARPWKGDLEVVLGKPGKKDYKLYKAYRMLSLTNEMGKDQEYLAVRRFNWRAKNQAWLHPSQFGFRSGRSVNMAMGGIVAPVENAISRRRAVLLMVFDVEGAFNKSWHPTLYEGLAQRGCPLGLFCQVASFLQDRKCQLKVQDRIKEDEAERLGEFTPGAYADDNWNLQGGNPDHLGALVQCGGEILVELFRWCEEEAKIAYSKDKLEVIGFTTAKEKRVGGKDVKFPDMVLDCPNMPQWHNHRVVVQRELEMLGFVLDRKLSWTAHVSKRVEKVCLLLACLQMCVRRTWGLKPRVVTLLWKGAVEPILLNGVVVWAAALKRKGVVKALRGAQRMAALAKTRCFKTTSTEAVLALAGMPPIDM
ncbi:unnamed protein product, partial [Heterosigma akashiwo]